MREIVDHKINPVNDTLTIKAVDQPGSGGANHEYHVSGFQNQHHHHAIIFQNGPISDVGVNGLTHEVLLAIVADRLRSFQAGQFSCKANACALTHIEEAMHWLQQRTLDRMRRGVEGTNKL